MWEARELVRMAGGSGVATQMGNQAHVAEPIRRVVELVRAGIIGDVTEAHVWTNRPGWPQGMVARPPKAPVPANVDWELWLGPAPFREYGKGYVPFAWRGWWDFGPGALGDMAWWSLELGVPTHVEAKHGGGTKESPPKWAVIEYQFPGRAGRDRR